jgi:imidazolonepropionase-like amidohydrolase
MKKIFSLILSIYTAATIAQIPVPAPPQVEPVLLRGAIAHIGNGQLINNSLIGISNGKIDFVVDANTASLPDVSKYTKLMDVTGKHVYPGFILLNTTLGLREVDAVRATLDFNETGTLNPNVRSMIAYNTDSKIIPTVRNNGVLIAQTVPRHGSIPGTSSVFELDGWNWEDAVLKADDGIHLNWPRMFTQSGWWAEPGSMKKNLEQDKQVMALKTFFRESTAYKELSAPQEKDLRYESMKGIFDGSKNLYIRANYVKEIIQAINFIKEFGIKKPVIVGGTDSWMVLELLKENNIPVILQRLHELPDKQDDDIDLPFKLPYILNNAGILFSFDYEGDMEAMGSRNLPFIAGTASAHGLTKEEAVMAISMNAAKILGISHRTGSLEAGKDATLFISSGDALDMKSNHVELALIRGKQIDLDDHQKQLYQRFVKKYQQE